MLNEKLLQKLSKEYDLKVNILNEVTAYVASKFDSWYIDVTEHKLILKHSNKKYHTNHEHIHRKYDNTENNYNIMFKDISNHDDFKVNKWGHKYFRINKLFDQIATSR